MIDDEQMAIFEEWKCDDCEMVATISPFERLQHVKGHQKEKNQGNTGTYWAQLVCFCSEM